MAKLLEIDNICFLVGTNDKQVRASGSLAEGGVLVIRGPSGSGKTTLLRILARLKEADMGRVLLNGKAWSEYHPAEWRRKVHYLSQKPVIFDGTVGDNLARPFELAAVKREVQFDLQRAAELMERLYLPAGLMDQDARTLSGGEASRMALVRALLTDPEVLLLDEPMAPLDSGSAGALTDLVAEWLAEKRGRGVVLVSHTGGLETLPYLSVLNIGREAGETGE